MQKENSGDLTANKEPKSFLMLTGFLLVVVLAGAAIGSGAAGTYGDNRKPCFENENDESQEPCPNNFPTLEPLSILLFSAGVAGLGFVARRHMRYGE